MMKNNLVEGKYGHGAAFSGKLYTKLSRKARPQIGMASVPFDWVKGFRAKDIVVGNVKIKNQNGSFSCGGQMKAYGRAVSKAIRKKQPYVEESAKASYEPVAVGSGGTFSDSLKKYQTFPESQVPSYDKGNPPGENFMRDASWRKDIKLLKDDWVPHTVSLDIESFAQVIRDYGYVYFMIAGQNNGTWVSANPKPPSKANPNEIWRHFMCGDGATMRNDKKVIYAWQSWGEDVGEDGLQYFGEDYFSSGHIIDAFVMAPPIDPTPAVINANPQVVVPPPVWYKGVVINWYVRFIIMLDNYGLLKNKPAGNNMNKYSLTQGGILIAVVGTVATHFLATAGLSEICTNEVVSNIPLVIGGVVAWIGRYRHGDINAAGFKKD